MRILRSLAGLIVLLFAAIPGAAFAFNAKAVPVAKGEDVWFAEDHTLPMIALVASFPAGSAYDTPEKGGLAAFAASMLDEGAGKLNSAAFHTELANRAIQLSVTPERDYMVVSLVTLSANAKEAFGLLGLALNRPRFDADAFARVRAQMIQSVQQDAEDPGTVGAKAFERVFYNGHPYAHPVTGDEKSLAAITPDDLRAFARSHWVRSGLKIAVAGDINTAALTAYLKSTFGNLPAQPPPLPPPAKKLGAPGVLVIPMNVPQPTIVFGLPGLLRTDRDFIPAYVMNYVLGGGGFSSRLMNEVREKRGLTYGISTDLSSLRRAGAWVGSVATRRDAVKQTIGVVRDTLKQFVADGPTDQELADAKTYLTGSFPLAFASNAGIAAQLSAFQRVGLPIGYVAKRNTLINAVTIEDVRRAAGRIIKPDKLTIVVAGTPGPQSPPKPPVAAKPALPPAPVPKGAKPPGKPMVPKTVTKPAAKPPGGATP